MGAEYRLTGRIESGELAELSKRLRDSAVPVVIKLFHQKTSDPAYAREMAEVSRLINPLPYPGIMHTVEVGLVKKRLAVVREDVEGFNLGVALQRLNTKE